MGIYKPVNFENYPVQYCGMKVTSNPYYG
jgi:hypothetical protein